MPLFDSGKMKLKYLLTAHTGPTVDESLQVEDQYWRQLLQTQSSTCFNLNLGLGADVSVQLFTGEVLSQRVVNTLDGVVLNVQLQSVEGLKS